MSYAHSKRRKAKLRDPEFYAEMSRRVRWIKRWNKQMAQLSR